MKTIFEIYGVVLVESEDRRREEDPEPEMTTLS